MIEQLISISKEIPLKLFSSTKDWFSEYCALTKDKSPIDQAIIGGFTCQQFSFAFLAGYQAALEIMFPSIATNQLKALCISEAKGNHPKTIETTLVDNRISGVKTYITAGSDVEHLLVLCKTSQRVNDRPLLKMVHIPRDANNVKISNFELPFMPEIKHGKLVLNDTKIEPNQILEGDGFSRYTKPFRTLEDICVGAAYQSMFLRQSIENQWKEELRDKLLLNIFTLKSLLNFPPSHQETILLLAATEQNFERLVPEIESHLANHANASLQTDWETNKRVIFMSKKLKELRLTKARNKIFG